MGKSSLPKVHRYSMQFKATAVLHAAQPIKEAFEAAHADHVNDGVKLDDLGAYAWALFSEITLRILPYKLALTDLSI